MKTIIEFILATLEKLGIITVPIDIIPYDVYRYADWYYRGIPTITISIVIVLIVALVSCYIYIRRTQ
jgi:hypothetical protein